MPQRRNKNLLALVILTVWVAVLGSAYIQRQSIFDWLALRNYSAPATIDSLATQDTMTPQARKIFYVNHPAIDEKTVFAKACPNNGGEQTIVLGCYHGNQNGIYLLDVTDTRLNGVEQVTAAHEMLHAAYDRLNSSQRTKVDTMLMDYYNNDLTDLRIKSTIAAYRKSEPNDVVNEMYSVFGTEIANLPSGLEQYYQQYFTNRSIVAGYAAQYQAEFSSRQAAVASDDAQLSSLKNQIESQESDLKSKQSQINNLQTQLMAERSSDPNAYNAAVPSFNSQVSAYNQEVGSVQGLIDRYNQLVAQRNAVALEEDQLVNDLNANVSAINR